MKPEYTHIPEFDAQLDTLAQIDEAMAQADEIASRSQKSGNVSKADSLTHANLMQKISILKSGVTADQYRAAALNAELLKSGRKPIIFANALTSQRRRLIEAFRQIARTSVEGIGAVDSEIRAQQTAGQVTVAYSNTAGGSFVPTSFMYSGLQNAMKSHSPLFDADKVSFVTTDTGSPMQLPLADDTSEVASVVGEAADDADYENIGGATQTLSKVYSYRTPKIKTTIEFGEDALANLHITFLENFFSERLARGVGHDLILGNGTSKPLGLIPALTANGVTPVTAAGSANDDGGVGTGANSIGSQDLRNLFYSVDRAYRNSPKAAWLMADSTLNAIDSLRDKMGHSQNLIKYNADGQPMLFGKPVYTDPNISPIAVSQQVVVFGDLSRWLTRYVPADSYLQVFSELPGFAEAGLVGWSANGRFGGSLLSSSAAQTPINYLQMHS